MSLIASASASHFSRSVCWQRIAPIALIAAMVASPAGAQKTINDPPVRAEPASGATALPTPKLIVAISVDQFSADLFSEYRNRFSGGMGRLMQGAVFPQGFQSHGATETCPGHSTILTGSHPSRTGIIANNWYDLTLARADKRVYCAEDPRVAGTSSASGKYAPSVQYLKVPTLGDRMKAANPAARVYAVAGKDRAAIMMGGHTSDANLWLSAQGFTSYRGTALPAVVERANPAIRAALATPRTGMILPDDCTGQDRAVPLANGASVGAGRFVRKADDLRAFLASPEGDGATLAMAAAIRADRKLGEGSATDLLIVGLSATDYVGHAYGTEGAEMCIQMHALDQQLGQFFTQLDASGIPYVVMLTADHGGHDLPERNRDNAMPTAARVDDALSPVALGKQLAARLHLPNSDASPLLMGDGSFGDFYLSRSLTPRQKTAALAELRRIVMAHPQVEAMITASELRATPLSTQSPERWTARERLRASFDPSRSGDFLLVLKPRVTPIPEANVGYVATHGSVWDYDRRVPMLFWRKGMTGFEQPNPVRTVDILPTLAALINLPLARAEIDGRCLDLIAGPGNSCSAGAADQGPQ